MSYLVLARKYRPQDFSQMVGQEHVVQVLRNALSAKRLHHGYFFTGTRGVGKTTVSRILARALNCTGPDGQGDVTPDPCGVCEACQAIAAGRFVDYTELDAASNRSVAEMQTLLEQAVYKPVIGRFKIFMIDEVHMLSTHAFNALLKTLEEPPEYLKFVLATTDAQKVPITVLSRCLQFNLRAMPQDTIVAQLSKVLQEEGISFDAPALLRLARAARGSMRDALSITDRAIAYGAGSVSDAAVKAMLGEVDGGTAAAILQALATQNGPALMGHIDQLRQNSASAASVLEAMLGLLQQVAMQQWRLNASTEGTSASLNDGISHTAPDTTLSLPEEQAAMQTLVQHLGKDEVQFLYSIVLQGRQDLGLAPDEYAALMMVLLRFWAFREPGSAPASTSGPAPGLALNDAEKKNTEGITARVDAAPSLAAATAITASAARQQSRVDTASPPGFTPDGPDDPGGPDHPIDICTSPIAAPTTEVQAPGTERQLLALPVLEMGAASAQTDRRIVAEVPSEAHQRWLAWLTARLDSASLQAMLRELALQAQCLEWTDTHMRLRVEQQVLTGDSLQAKLELWLQQQGLDLALIVEYGPVEDSLARQHKMALEERRLAARTQLEASPLVQSLLQNFSARWIERKFVLFDHNSQDQ